MCGACLPAHTERLKLLEARVCSVLQQATAAEEAAGAHARTMLAQAEKKLLRLENELNSQIIEAGKKWEQEVAILRSDEWCLSTVTLPASIHVQGFGRR